ncbi:MAG: thioredoxin family protein [Planctomycetia bacterium]
MQTTTTPPGTTPPRPIPGAGTPPTPEAWQAAFEAALPYRAYLDRFANPDQRGRWDAFHARVALSPEQTTLLGSFKRRMPVLVLSGAWCGDCATQCPIFDHFAAASPTIDLRFLDRDARPDIAAHLAVCGGQRVPTVAFLSEDWHLVVFYGDKTLSAYRAAAASQAGNSCATGLATPADAIAAATADWLDQFERVQLILRLSGRLRQIHGD